MGILHYENTPYYLLEVKLLEQADADLVVQPNFRLKPFDPKFADTWWKTTHWSPPLRKQNF